MSIIGLDIGTTTLSAVVLSETDGQTIDRVTVPHCAFLPGLPHERIQDAGRIVRLALDILDGLSRKHAPVRAVGLTGQMHGVVYTDSRGDAVSPLYTWQDGRGSLPLADGRTPAAALSEETGYPLAAGYGAVTHAHLIMTGQLPASAVSLCTIHAFLAMKLTGRTRPLLHASDAASIGCYDLAAGQFDRRALARLRPEFFPETTASACAMGRMPSGATVVTALGDNQASFLGAMNGREDGVLVNIGTGSQISMKTDRPISCPGAETRPLNGGEYLLVGAPLCGGRAYAMLERFLRDCAALAGLPVDSLYGQMNRLAETAPQQPLTVDTRFCGTRQNPGLRGSIRDIGEDNFTPHHLIYGTLRGMADELYEYCRAMQTASGRRADSLTASGNAVRMNPALQTILSETFGLPVRLPDCEEEAASGSAYLAAKLL